MRALPIRTDDRFLELRLRASKVLRLGLVISASFRSRELVTEGGSMQRQRSAQRPLFGAAVVLLLAMAIPVVLALPGTATSGTSQRPVYQPPQSYYLALGDSITYGFQPTKAKAGAPPSAFRTGYVDVFAARLRKLSPQLEVINYGCPGESTVTFTRGGCPAFTDGIKLHDAFRGSQLKAAVSFLQAHPGEVSPVTLTLFGNDWLPLLLDTCKGDVACIRKRGPGAIASFGSRLTSIVQRLRAAAPTAEIIVTGAWNPDPNQLTQLKPIYRSLEASIARAATLSRARVAKMLPVFNPARNGQARLCALTFICSKGDPHPTDAGYRVMADAHMAASGYPRK
jgi:lysophospholipase L1-like esterase